MKTTFSRWIPEFVLFSFLTFGLVAIAQAQDVNNDEPKKTVRVEVEVTENGNVERKISEIEYNAETVQGQLDEMVNEIESILHEAVKDIDETDLEITIRRNSNGQAPEIRYQYNYSTDGKSQVFRPELKPMLGVYVKESIVGNQMGVEIIGLVAGSAAEAAGLEKGDVIMKMDDERVTDHSELAYAIHKRDIGEIVTITYVRDEKEESMEVELGEQSLPHWDSQVQMIAPRFPNAVFLGVVGESYDDGDETQGVELTNIVSGSSAEKAGLEEGDIVLRFDGEEVESFMDLSELIKDHKPGDEVEIVLIRDGKSKTIEVELGKREMHRNNVRFDYNYTDDVRWDGDLEERPFLGVSVKQDDEVSEGLLVTKVFDGSTAQQIGLEKGDVILELDGEEVEDLGDFIDRLEDQKAGDAVKVKYKRDEATITVKGKLGSKADFVDQVRTADGDKKIIHVKVIVDMNEDEIRELSKKSGEELDQDNSLELESFTYAPNPTSGELNLRFEAPEAGDLSVIVMNSNGEKIESVKISGFEGEFNNQYDLSDLPAGMYFISILQNGKGKTVRVVKQ